MRKVAIDFVNSGDILAKSIYGIDNIMLLKKGTILSCNYILKLKRLGFNSLYIEDGLIDDVIIDELISDETRNQAIISIKNVTNKLKNNLTINISILKNVVNDILDEVQSNRNMMACLNDICSYDDYTFSHSVNVTVLSLLIGMNSFYDRNKLLDLGTGVILHDIGKVQISPKIINKADKLTYCEYETVKKHTEIGFEMLHGNIDIKITSAHIAFQHHERYDGSGYPRGLKGKDILGFARIASIADVFDAMGNDRCYRKKLPLQEVYKYLSSESGKLFDPLILEKFIQRIAVYPQGIMVMISDGRKGFVVRQNCDEPEKPVVRLFWDCDGATMSQPKEVNLLNQPELSIIRVIENI